MRFVKTFICLVCLVAMSAMVTPALAEYPKKPIKLIVPFPPGGQSDLAARFLAKALNPYFPKVTVVNMPSAGAVTGAAFVANSKPDGYTMLLGWATAVSLSPAFFPEIPYKWDSFDHISLLQKHPYALIAGTESGYKTFKDLETEIKTGKKEIDFATAAPSTVHNIAIELMLKEFGMPSDRVKFVPYDGGGPATTAVIGNHLDLFWQGVSPLVSPIQGGQVLCLAVTSAERLKTLPDCPTVRELGYPNLEQINSWGTISGPKGLPKDVFDKWVEVLGKIAKDPEWLKDMETVEAIPMIGTPEEAKAYVKAQYELAKELNSVE